VSMTQSDEQRGNRMSECTERSEGREHMHMEATA
jgi:hypothetical protein